MTKTQNKETMKINYIELLEGLKKEESQNFMLGLGLGHNKSTEEFQFDIGDFSIIFEANHTSEYREGSWGDHNEIYRDDEVLLSKVLDEEGTDMVGELLVSQWKELVNVAKTKIIFE